MNDKWNYGWVTDSTAIQWLDPAGTMYWLPQEQRNSIVAQPLHFYVRTQWEPRSDGISKLHMEMLGFITYNTHEKIWSVQCHEQDDWIEMKHSSMLAAKGILEKKLKLQPELV
ncbi:MAG: hypothetical protein ABIN80_18705 [Dyadobacter sp.]|uniref:hypothetical protein n=1 Tax=Dyadobacter sp. TaxID=1914288 RepID=UPI003267C74E